VCGRIIGFACNEQVSYFATCACHDRLY
jgi:hypothetical protein